MDWGEEIVGEFLRECSDDLERFDDDLLVLEDDPSAAGDVVPGLFRTLHSIKGAAGLLGYRRMEALSHRGEALLARVRDGDQAPTRDLLAAFVATATALREMMSAVAATGSDDAVDPGELLALLERLTVSADGPKKPPPRLGEMLVNQGKVTAADVERAVALQHAGDGRHLGEILVDEGLVEAADILAALNAQSTARTDAPDSSVRVGVTDLDHLRLLAVGLIAAAQELDAPGHPRTLPAVSRIRALASELHAGLLDARLQPLSALLSPLPRAVREVAAACGRRVGMTVEWPHDVRVDRAVLEGLRAPLTHLLRNAVDHGVEAPEERVRAGKPALGTVRVDASVTDGTLVLQVVDDGRGVDAEAVRERAVARGILADSHARYLTTAEVLELIFVPGFSTTESVTTVSGRGVGMDVVRTNVIALGGTVRVASRVGIGTTVILTLPLTAPSARAATALRPRTLTV